jgi:cytochrome b pre-mRNA-processing protein 3
MLSWWRDRRETKTRAGHLYAAATDRARDVRLFTDLRVADTVDGRTEMLVLHVALLVDRLGRVAAPRKAEGEALAMALTEAFVTHMDDTLRHIGVGDLAVPRKVKKAAAALYDAHRDYGAALAAGSDATSAWRHALHLHLISRGAAPEADIAGLADHAMASAAALAATSDADMLAGRLV